MDYPLPDRLVFFLGGYDLEMVTIRALLEQEAPDRFYDKRLIWGARASAYADEIRSCVQQGFIPALIELEDDLALEIDHVIVVDHHGSRAGADHPTALHQVFALLDLPVERWTRWHDLVAANDRGAAEAMAATGATPEEIAHIRAADRAAQGVTPEEEQAGQEAVTHAETPDNGRLTVVRLPHARTATVTDRLERAMGGPGYANVLIVSPNELNVYGEGAVIDTLRKTFPNGWYGGSLPERGFWGHGEPLPEIDRVIALIVKKA